MLSYMKALSKTEIQFQANLKKLITAIKIEHTALAKQSGVSLRMIQSILSGERGPSLVMAEKLAKTFKVESWHMLYSGLTLETMKSKRFNQLIKDYLSLTEEDRKEIAQAAHSLSKLDQLKAKREASRAEPAESEQSAENKNPYANDKIPTGSKPDKQSQKTADPFSGDRIATAGSSTKKRSTKKKPTKKK